MRPVAALSPRAWALSVLCISTLACAPVHDSAPELLDAQAPSMPVDAQSVPPDAGESPYAPPNSDAGSTLSGADSGVDAAVMPDGGAGDAGPVHTGCGQSAGFECGGYAFSYTELKGIEVSLGQGHATAPGVAIPRVSGLGTLDCASGRTTTIAGSGYFVQEGESDPESVFAHVDLRTQAEPDPLVQAFAARVASTELTRSFELFTSRPGPAEQLQFEAGPAPDGQCGDTHVWWIRRTLVLDVIAKLRFPDAAALAHFSEHSLQQVLSTFTPPEDQAAADRALRESGAQLELHVAASGASHERLRAMLESSACRGDAPAECRATVAALRDFTGEMAERGEGAKNEFRTRPYEP